MQLRGLLRRCLSWLWRSRLSRSRVNKLIGLLMVTCVLYLPFILPATTDERISRVTDGLGTGMTQRDTRQKTAFLNLTMQNQSSSGTSDLQQAEMRLTASVTRTQPHSAQDGQTELRAPARVTGTQTYSTQDGQTELTELRSTASVTGTQTLSTQDELTELTELRSTASLIGTQAHFSQAEFTGSITRQLALGMTVKSDKMRPSSGFAINEVKGESLTYYNMSLLSQRNMERVKRMQEMCRGNQRKIPGSPSRDLWAYKRMETHQIINTLYCPVQKVGSTFWQRVFHAIHLNKTIDSPYNITIKEALGSQPPMLAKLLPLDKPSTQNFLDKSLKMMFVREPFSRLLSGYNDKLFAPNPFYWNHVGKFIIKHYRKNASTKSLNCGHDVTFPEFVKYVIDSVQKKKISIDQHFIPVNIKCKPCQIHYNAIGKIETFKEDLAYILNTLGYNVSVNTLQSWAEESVDDAVTDSTFSPFGWKRDIKKCMSFHEAAKRIWHKMQIRGIVRRDTKMPFSELETDTVTSKQFVGALLESRGTDREFLKQQKREILQKIYQMVPSDDIEQIRNLYKSDFELFGYDLYPQHIFSDTGGLGSGWLFNLSGI